MRRILTKNANVGSQVRDLIISVFMNFNKSYFVNFLTDYRHQTLNYLEMSVLRFFVLLLCLSYIPLVLASSPTFNPTSSIPTLGSHSCVSTIAGTGTSSSTGNGGLASLATLSGPRSVWTDTLNNIYISESTGFSVRMISAESGIITRVVGTGIQTAMSGQDMGDNGVATSATLYTPNQVHGFSSLSLIIADSGNNNVRGVAVGTNIISNMAGDF